MPRDFDRDKSIVRSHLTGLARELLNKYHDPQIVDIILHEAVHEAVLRVEEPQRREEEMPRVREPVTAREFEPREVVRVINYQSEQLYSIASMTRAVYDVSARTLGLAEMTLKGICLFCGGNLQVEMKGLQSGDLRVYLNCLKQGHNECRDYKWEIGIAARVPR